MLASHQPDVIQSSLHEVTKYLLFSRVLRFFVEMSQSLICSCFQSSLVQLNDLNISMIATWRANAWRVKLFENKIQTIQKLPGGEVQIPDCVEPKLLKQIFKLKTTLILMQNIQLKLLKWSIWVMNLLIPARSVLSFIFYPVQHPQCLTTNWLCAGDSN